ncbi:hypothetical protein SISNIDRAFT_465841 [Sistotremastrum niveocremeum HHB9708]|uniref:Uncharacterized protein n=1 Tax=Sistotremastrum niveocremeum HHB9708 TaxID=1314777 RepID=A0A164UYV7_9AGAM|nr:hypothetical protein SISNIDRAFT_465841 [Sistotremastrum niveocremeum HHB9708]
MSTEIGFINEWVEAKFSALGLDRALSLTRLADLGNLVTGAGMNTNPLSFFFFRLHVLDELQSFQGNKYINITGPRGDSYIYSTSTSTRWWGKPGAQKFTSMEFPSVCPEEDHIIYVDPNGYSSQISIASSLLQNAPLSYSWITRDVHRS